MVVELDRSLREVLDVGLAFDEIRADALPSGYVQYQAGATRGRLLPTLRL